MTTLYHGAHTEFSLHPGQCFSESEAVAKCYAAQNGFVAQIVVDLDGLNVVTLDEGYDRNANESPADHDLSEFEGIDVIVFEDEDESGRQHTTHHIISYRALNAVEILSIESVRDD